MRTIIAAVALSFASPALSADAPPEGVTQREVTVGADGWPLPGLLTLPDGDGPFPAVVLVHGSGPHDADETIFGNKPFRDLAHGLAAHGIGSLRYVKRSKEHGARLAREHAEITVEAEAIADAAAAVRWLRAQPQVDAGRIFVLGHSLGAMLAPRIGRSAPETAGLILLAANARPLENLVVEQVRYLAPSQGITDAQIAEFEAQRDRVKALVRGEAVDGPLLLNVPASYWRDLSAYDPIAAAKSLDRPMLVLQGERDYQVTMADFALWKQALGDRPNVTLKSYPALNHLFVAGEGPSLPIEYLKPGHVDTQVIADIAQWIETIGDDSAPPARADKAQVNGSRDRSTR